jgi:hypothetical protein
MRRLLGPLTYPSLSPDGRYFAFEFLSGHAREIHAIDLHTGEEIEVARGVGRCHCTSPDRYGYPEWASTNAVLAFRDHGDFLAPPEEGDESVSVLYDLSTRRRLGTPPAADQMDQMTRLPRCGSPSTLWYADGVHRLEFTRSCGSTRTPPPAPSN